MFDNQTIGTAAKLSSASWKVPSNAAKGTYVVKVGVFSPGWGTMYAWNDRAVTFTVK